MFTTILVAIFTAFTLVGANRAIIENHCPFKVYIFAIDSTRDAIEPSASLNLDEVFIEQYQRPKFGGVSLKLSRAESLVSLDGQTPITQFEYFLNTGDDKVYYDLSNINCDPKSCPFAWHGLHLRSSSGCRERMCSPYELECGGAYLYPTDDTKTTACDDTTGDLVLSLCDELVKNTTSVDSVEPASLNSANPCEKWHMAEKGDNCWLLKQWYGVPFEQFYSMYPSVGRRCEALQIDREYCVRPRNGTNAATESLGLSLNGTLALNGTDAFNVTGTSSEANTSSQPSGLTKSRLFPKLNG